MEEKKAAEEFRLRQHAGPHPAHDISLANQAFQGLQPPGSLTSAVPLNHHPSQPLPDSTRIILHFDADCFYAQCEELRDTSIRERPLGVTQKFLIVTCNYIARARGVTKLMSIKEAQQRCPDLVLINGEDLTPYRHASKSMISVLKRYGTVQKLGLDEIFVDVTTAVEARLQQNHSSSSSGSAASFIHGHVHVPGQRELQQDNKYRPMDLRATIETKFPTTTADNGNFSNKIENSTSTARKMTDAYESFPWWPRIAVGSIIAHEARHAIKTETGLRTSAGIACNKLLAKLSSGLHKPDDQTLLLPCYAADFVHPLPVRALPSVGHKLEADLVAAGLGTVGSLRNFPESQLVEQFGSRVGNFLTLARWGKDTSEVIEQGPPKSVTVEDSFRSCRGYPATQQVLQVLAPDLVARLQEEEEENGRRPTKLILKWRVKGQGWNRTSASCVFPVVALTQAEELQRVAMQLLAANVKEPFDLTLISIGGTAFVDSNSSTNNGTERNIADMLQLLPRSGGGGGSSGVFQQPEHPVPSAAASPAVAAGLSLKRRRDYGTGADQAPLSKRAERMLRQQGSSGGAHGAGRGTKPLRGGVENAYAIEEDEDVDLWDDLADLHDPLHSKQPRTGSRNGNQRPTPGGAVTSFVSSGVHGGDGSSGDRGGSVYLAHNPSTTQRVIIHWDVDSFYCSVERLDDPSLRNVPLAVEQFNSGGFVAVSYEARAAGIRCGDGAGAAGRAAVPHLAAMKARSLEECRIACPGLVVRGMRPQRYREVGRAVHDLLKSVVGHMVQVEKASCDDFYLDVTNLCCVTSGDKSIETIIKQHLGLDFSIFSLYQSAPDGLKYIHGREEEEDCSTIWSTLSSDLQIGIWIAHIIRQVLSQKLGLTASCAVARNKLISRLASPTNKPNGLTLVPSDSAAVSFIGTIPIHRVPSLQGKFGAEVQETLKIHLVKDLVNFDQKDLEAKFGPARGKFLSDLPKAIDDTHVAERGPPKSITSERSFPPAKSQDAVINIIKHLVELLLIRGAEDFAEHHSRLPVKLGVAFRLGYDTNLVSRSGAVPLKLLNWLRASLSTSEFCDGAADAIDAATNAVMVLLRGATNGLWDITRAAVVLHYNDTTINTANGPQQQLFKAAVQAPRKGKDKETLKKEEENQSLAGPSKVQSIKKRGSNGSGARNNSTYRNAEALALQAMFSGSGSGSEQVGLPSSYVVNGGSASEDLDKASLELALKLQREEAEAMASSNSSENFPSFPYPPYDIQLGFMKALYAALDKGGVGLFESPTGTGKTLSLICGSLTWLQDIRERERLEAEAAAAAKEQEKGQDGSDGEGDVPSWMADFATQQEEQRKKEQEEDRSKRIAKAKAKLIPKQPPKSNEINNLDGGGGDGDVDGEFLLDEVDDLDGTGGSGSGAKKRRPGAVDPLFLLSDSDEEDDATIPFGEAEEPKPPQKTQILFCSRTHSQLTQFVGELHRTPFADVMSLVSLGSRRALCINEDVLRLKVPGLINERCLELQKPPSAQRKKITDAAGEAKAKNKKSSKTGSSSSTTKCIYLAAGTKSADITRDMILAQPIDIEALASLGRKRSVCPYYASRRATPEADIILAPYSALLVEDTRKALGLKVEGNVIIVDEAHNLADAINGSHSAELHASTAETAHRQLKAYFDRFRTQLAPVNARNVQALMRAADALAKSARGTGAAAAAASTAAASTAKAVTVNDFLFSTGLDNVNMFQLVRHVKQSKAVFKVAGFYQALQRRTAAAAAEGDKKNYIDNNNAASEGATGSLHAVLSFLQALTNNDTDGRVVSDPASGTVKFVLLNAAAHFASVVSSARAVVLASGTLSPLETVLDLFPSVAENDIHKYSCGHVVGKERLLAVAVGAGPGGTAFDFRHGSRGSHETIDELGRLVLNTCTAAPGGVVVFFPSFSYADQVHARWAVTGMLRTLGERKKVFREPRTAGEVDSVLEEYATCIETNSTAATARSSKAFGIATSSKCTGAVMLCVVGGKLAEGINFGDDLGRCVIMVGLPYPNPSDPELQERLRFIDRNLTATTTTTGSSSTSSSASREYYSNLCMKAVNQCIGRAIRHRRDYAAVLLVDVRYAAGGTAAALNNNSGSALQFTGVLAKLPCWIQQSLVACPKFGDAYGRLVRFYKGMAAAAEAEAAATEAAAQPV